MQRRAALLVAKHDSLFVGDVLEEVAETLAIVSLHGVEEGLGIEVDDRLVINVQHEGKA